MASVMVPLVLLILVLSPTASQTIHYDHYPYSYDFTSEILRIPSIVAMTPWNEPEPRCNYEYFSFHGEGGRLVNADLVGINDYVGFYVMNTQQFLNWKRYSQDCSPYGYMTAVDPVVLFHLSWAIPDDSEYYFLFTHACCSVAVVRFSATIIAT